MAGEFEKIIPTVVGGAIALKFLDVAMPDKKTAVVRYVARPMRKVKVKKMTAKQKARCLKAKRCHYENGKLYKIV